LVTQQQLNLLIMKINVMLINLGVTWYIIVFQLQLNNLEGTWYILHNLNMRRPKTT
jgi:hypothetical protein